MGGGARNGRRGSLSRRSAAAQVALGRFGWRREFEEDRDRAQHRFWDAAADLLNGRMPPEVAEQGEVFFQDWFTADFRLESGRTLIELLLERERRQLRPGEVRYLSRARLTHLRPYEVVGVRPDEGLDLLDLWARKPIRVHERLGTRQLVQWDVVAARLMLGAEGVPVIDGAPYLYPARARDPILKDLRRVHRTFRRQVPGDDVDFLKRFGSFFFLWWIAHAVLPSRPQIRTAEGDEFVSVKAVFDALDPEVIGRALAGHPDLDYQDDGSYAWYEPGATPEFRRALGSFVLDGRRATLETTSRARAERGRALLESLAGDAVRYRATSLESTWTGTPFATPSPSGGRSTSSTPTSWSRSTSWCARTASTGARSSGGGAGLRSTTCTCSWSLGRT